MKSEDLTDAPEDDVDDPLKLPQWRQVPFSVEFTSAAPLNNFFEDEFFTLLHLYNDDVPYPLQRIKQKLARVSDESVSESERAQAALSLAEHVVARAESRDALIQNDMVRAVHWFELAIKLGSVSAATNLAQLHLTSNQVLFAIFHSRFELPFLISLKSAEFEERNSSNWQAYTAWYRGARLGLRQLEHGFDGWNMPEFDEVFTCILCYLTLVPRKQWRPLSEAETEIETRVSALSWIEPLWHELVRLSAPLVPKPDAYRLSRYEQFQAALLIVDAKDLAQDEQPAKQRTNLASPGHQREVRVITGNIPAASDRSDNEYLKRFEPLRKPIALTRMPNEARLQEIHRALRNEFPWADDVISQVVSDLTARSRYGVLPLGMSAIALAGLPGSGKTRFSHRLSQLLGTPNTVINMAGMGDAKLFKGFTRGWGGSRPSRIVEFIQQTRIANPLFILDEIDKAGNASMNGGNPHEALLDLLEPTNARRYQDLFLLTECDLSHCIYIATANALEPIPEPVRSRLRLLYFPSPGPEHSDAIIQGMLKDMERSWRLPEGTLMLSTPERERLKGLQPRQMRHAVIDILGAAGDRRIFTRH